MAPKIDAARLWRSILETALIGATENGGVRRLALSDEDRRIREWFFETASALGCDVRVDRVGNVFARRPGRRNDLPPIAMGGHFDTQLTSGRFDGAVGVLAGLEILRCLAEESIETQHPIELIDWTNEQGARFSPGLLGSAVFAGELDLQGALEQRDAAGRRVDDELGRIGYRGNSPCHGQALAAYVELHVEHEPVTVPVTVPKDQGATIAVVGDAQNRRWFGLEIDGTAAPGETAQRALGAHHAAVHIAKIAPAATIYIPCEPGSSRNETERVKPQHIAAGAEVLLRSVLARDAADRRSVEATA